MRIYEIVFVAVVLFAKAEAEATDSLEEQTSFGVNQVFVPSTVNFNEIFSNSLSMLNDDILTTVTKDASTKDDSQLPNMPLQFAEFRMPTTTIPTTTTTPPPRFPTAAYMREDETQASSYSSTSPTTSRTTTEPDEPKKVLPIRRDHQRGVLDLIMPAARVKNIKFVFDSFRKMLSYTFRK